METEFDVVKNVSFFEGCVYKTRVVGKLWLPCPHRKYDEELAAIAQFQGGDILQPTGKFR